MSKNKHLQMAADNGFKFLNLDMMQPRHIV